MRGLVEDTKKLALTNNNNNNNISGALKGNRTATATATKTTPTPAIKPTTIKKTTATASASASSPTTHTSKAQLKNVKTNKFQSMQQQQQQQPKQANKMGSSTKATTTTAAAAAASTITTTSNNSSSAASTMSVKRQKPNSQQQQPQQQQQQLKQQQQQPMHNNNSHTITLPKASHANTNEEIAGGVQDTIYLCNFRVSVDGEWLCLKELQDIDVGQTSAVSGVGSTHTSMATIGTGGTTYGVANAGSGGGIGGHASRQQQTNFGQKNKRYSGLSTHGLEDNGILALENLIGRCLYDIGSNSRTNNSVIGLIGCGGGGAIAEGGGGECANLLRDTAEIERSNLVNICKLVVKELLEQSLRYGRMLDSDHLPLQHFFIVIEHVLGHGLRPKKGLLGPRKELWDLLQSVENYCPEAQDITASVRDLPTVRTHIGRARAWLRIALMQKKLSDYLQALIEHREDALYDYYESHALMMSDEIVVIMGILVGLNVIDCNLCVKEEDLDSQQGVIDFSLYLRSSSRNADTNDDTNQVLDTTGQGNMIAVLDQKNYIEELNRHLNATVANLQAKVESLTTTNALMKEDLAIARNSLLALQAENQAMRQVSGGVLQAQSNTQNDTSSNSSGNEKSQIEALNAELLEERRKYTELDKELKLQVSLKAESDMAMKLLEKDIHEKQDTIISLRRQLEDIKQINLEMYRKLQDCEASLKHKSDLLTKLEIQKEDMAGTIAQLEKKWSSDKNNLGEILKNTSQTLSTQVTASEERAARAEAEARIEREWRVSLQDKENKLKEKITGLQTCVKELNEEKQKNDKLKYDLEKLRTQWTEAQTTLEELGIQLSVSKLKIAELQEHEKRQQNLMSASSTSSLQQPTTEGLANPGIWAPDSIASHCTACRREFNLTRRKHHCRSCGEIFCKACSEHTLALLNDQGHAGKPVRVCDNCFTNSCK